MVFMVFMQQTHLNACLIPKFVLSDCRSCYCIERKTSENTQLNLLMVIQHKRKGVANMTDVGACLLWTDSKLE
jgi:hypothetical protein